MTNSTNYGEVALTVFTIVMVMWLTYGLVYEIRKASVKPQELKTVVTKEQQCAIDRGVSRCIFIGGK
jgi:hypothetical protein